MLIFMQLTKLTKWYYKDVLEYLAQIFEPRIMVHCSDMVDYSKCDLIFEPVRYTYLTDICIGINLSSKPNWYWLTVRHLQQFRQFFFFQSAINISISGGCAWWWNTYLCVIFHLKSFGLCQQDFTRTVNIWLEVLGIWNTFLKSTRVNAHLGCMSSTEKPLCRYVIATNALENSF